MSKQRAKYNRINKSIFNGWMRQLCPLGANLMLPTDTPERTDKRLLRTTQVRKFPRHP